MKRTILALILCFVALPLCAQVATLSTPEAQPTGTKLVVTAVAIDAINGQAKISLVLQAVDGTTIRSADYTTFSQAEYVSFMTALGSARASETGTVPRRLQYRVLGWMSDNSKFTNAAGQVVTVTVAP